MVLDELSYRLYFQQQLEKRASHLFHVFTAPNMKMLLFADKIMLIFLFSAVTGLGFSLPKTIG